MAERSRRVVIAAVAMVISTIWLGGKVAPIPPQDPQEPQASKPTPTLVPPPAGAISSADADQEELRDIINGLVSCGTRDSLSSWTDPNRGIGCGRNHIVSRLESISKATGGLLQVNVDRFQATSPRTSGQPMPTENVVAILPGSDPVLVKTAFVVSGHFDSMPSNVMDATSDAPGADDDASGSAVSIECARLLSSRRPAAGYRATLVFAAVSGEEQGLLGGKRLLEYLRQEGYTIGGMLDNDIVGADFAPGAPHRIRIFSEGGPDGVDSASRELARAVEEIDSQQAVRLIFRVDRLGRGGDHMPFVEARLPAVRFTEPLEDYHHEHQTPRLENEVQYGDLPLYLNVGFIANVVRDNAEALRQLALAPSPPEEVTLSGAVSPSAVVTWRSPKDADRAGFELLWRETTSPRWSVFDFVTEGAERALEGVSTDNHFFAVRAVGKNGARSIAVPALPRRRSSPPALPSATQSKPDR